MIRGSTQNVLLAPRRASDLLPVETGVPAQLALRNGTLTDAGLWRKRPGMGGGLTLGSPAGVELLIPDSPGYAVADDGQIYLLSASRAVIDADLAAARQRVVDLASTVPQITDYNYILNVFVTAGVSTHPEVVPFMEYLLWLVTYRALLDRSVALALFPPTTAGWYPRRVDNAGLLAAGGHYRPTYANYDGVILLADGGPVRTLTYDAEANTARMSSLGGSPPNARFVATLDTYVILATGAATTVRGESASTDPLSPIEFRWSGVNDPTDWDMETGGAGNNFTAAVGESIEMMKVLRKELYLFLTHSIEVWVNIGASQVFARQSRIAKGTEAGYSVVQANDTFYWLGDDGYFYRLDGLNPRIVSLGMRSSTDVVRDRASVYGFDFRREHVIRWFAPTEGRCFVYDYARESWSEDDSWQGAGQARLEIGAAMEWEERAYVGDRRPLGRVYQWSTEHQSDDGQPIRVKRAFQMPLSADGTTARVNRVRFRVQRGEGLPDGQAPMLLWRHRFDQGDWSPVHEAALGAGGEVYPYVDSHALGVGHELALELVETDAVTALVTHALVTAEPLGR